MLLSWEAQGPARADNPPRPNYNKNIVLIIPYGCIIIKAKKGSKGDYRSRVGARVFARLLNMMGIGTRNVGGKILLPTQA